jgi:CysZ protein
METTTRPLNAEVSVLSSHLIIPPTSENFVTIGSIIPISQPSMPDNNKSVPSNRGLGGFLIGATYPLRALIVLGEQPSLRSYVLIPIVLNLVIGVTVYSALLTGGLHLIDQWISSLPQLAGELAQWHPPAVSLPDVSLSLPSWLHWPTWLHLPQLPLPHIPLPHLALPHWSIAVPALPNFKLPDWLVHAPLAIVAGLLRFVLTILLLLITGFVFLQFGFILGAPFYGKLSEAVERLKTGGVEIIEINPLREIGRAISYELKKLGLLIGIGLPLLLLNLLPGLGTAIATIGTISLSATLVCLDFFDGTLERRRLKFRQKLGIVRRSLPASGGFALICFGLVSIPLINLVGIPICVMAGTLFCCDRVLPLNQT